MGIPVLILGESGSGKSASLRNFEQGEVLILNVADKPLPFRKRLDKVNGAGYRAIYAELRAPRYKRYVIDDSQYLMTFELFAKSSEVGYQKFTDLANHFYNMLKIVRDEMPRDVIVYLLHHTEIVDGRIKAKTIGKMLDEKLTLEGLFSIVLLCQTDGRNHQFITQSDGYTTAKSPMEMFPLAIENDLKMVDDTIREYYKEDMISTTKE